MLPISTHATGAAGADTSVAVTVSGIKTNDVLLSLIRWKPAEAPAAVATASFTVADGTITSESVSTDGYKLWVVWYRAA